MKVSVAALAVLIAAFCYQTSAAPRKSRFFPSSLNGDRRDVAAGTVSLLPALPPLGPFPCQTMLWQVLQGRWGSPAMAKAQLKAWHGLCRCQLRVHPKEKVSKEEKRSCLFSSSSTSSLLPRPGGLRSQLPAPAPHPLPLLMTVFALHSWLRPTDLLLLQLHLPAAAPQLRGGVL